MQASIFKRALRDPAWITDAELALLSDEEREMLAARCDCEIEAIDAAILRSLGGEPRKRREGLPPARLQAILDDARREGFDITKIPMGDWAAMCLDRPQMDALNAALGEKWD